jgi:uncharacterized protein (UPF0333 family)
MGIEWFRDLSIIVMGFVTAAVLIFVAVLVYRLYRTIKSILLRVETTSKIAHDTVATVQENIEMASNFAHDTVATVQENIEMASNFAHNTVATMQENIEMASNFAHDTVATMQEALKPLLPILAVIQGIRVGYDGISSMFKQESNKGGNSNE